MVYKYICVMVFRFQIYNFFAPSAFISAIFKDIGRQYKCYNISNSASPRAIILTNLDSIVDSDTNHVICHLQQHNNSRHS